MFVTTTDVIAVTDTLGKFAMSALPRGEYSVHVWHELTGFVACKQIRLLGSAIAQVDEELIFDYGGGVVDIGGIEIDAGTFQLNAANAPARRTAVELR